MTSSRSLRATVTHWIPVSFLILLYCSSCGGSRETPKRGGADQALSVDILLVRPQFLENKIFIAGTLFVNEEVEIRSEISGRVIGLFFEEGRRAHKGDLLMKINDQELKAQFTQKELEATLAGQDEARKRRLLDMKGISQEEYDRSLTSLQLIQAEKDEIAAQLAKTEISAPFDGIVGLRHISAGGYVSPNMVATTIQDVDPIKVDFSVPEKYARLVKTGLPIVVQVGEDQTEHKGIVYAVESKIDPETRTIKARAKIPNPKGALMPGAFARVAMSLEQIPDAIVVPSQAIIPVIDGAQVFVCRDGKAASVSVTTGIRTDRDVQITSGLTSGDSLILTGLLQLTVGRSVKAASPNK